MTNYPPPPPMQQPGYGYRPDHPRATVSLVLGIVSLVLCSILGPVAWVIGGRTVSEIDASGGQYGGRGQAMAGKVCGIIATVLLALGILFAIAVGVLGFSMSSSHG